LNPLTDKKVNNINQKIDESLSLAKPSKGKNITYDIPVTRLIVEVHSDILQMKYDTHEEEYFYFDFQLEKTEGLEGNFKDMIEPLFEQRNLPQQGFNWRVPVLRQIIPNQGFDADGDSHDPVFSWNPENPNTEPLPKTTSQKIAGMLPNNIGYHKEVEMVNNEYWGI
jgi:hypothetical protein